MAKGINFEPYRTVGGFKNGFNLSSEGYIQGDAQADPAVRLQLRSGWIDNEESGAIIGGMPVSVSISKKEVRVAGNTLRPATTRAEGVCVTNQAYHAVITASNNVPTYTAGMTAHYYLFGTLARIPMAVSQAVYNLGGDNNDGKESINQVFVWDADNLCVDLQTPGDDGGASADTRVVLPIKLLTVENANSMVIVKDANDTYSWKTGTGANIGVFEI